MPTTPSSRPVYLTREGEFIRLAFQRDETLINRARKLPYARFETASRTWMAYLCAQTLEQLRAWHYEGLVVNHPDTLLTPGEAPAPCREALVRPGGRSRPFVVHTAWRDDRLWSRLTAVTTAEYSKKQQALTYAPQAAVALGELVDAGVLDDPEQLLTPAPLTVAFDARDGRFKLRTQEGGDEPRRQAQAAFDHYFPTRDPVAGWRSQGLQVAFTDPLSEQVYRGELSRAAGGFQPEGLLLDLFPFQRAAVGYLTARNGGVVADQPGLGKTATGIATAYELLANRQSGQRVVVVCPAGVRSHWEREIVRFTGDDHIVVIDGDKSQRRRGYEAATEARWVIVHFDVLRREWDLEQITPAAKGAILLVDEAHRIRNHTTNTSQAVRKLGKAAVARVALTGTPIENAPDEFYWVLSFAHPGVLGRWGEFAERYMYPGRFGGFEGARNLTDLARRAAPHFLRRLKTDVAQHLPPLRVQHLPLNVTEAAYSSLLRRVHQQARDELEQSAQRRDGNQALGYVHGWDEVSSAAEMTAVGMLRMLCSSPELLHRSDSPAARTLVDAGLVPRSDGPKVEQLRAFVAELRAAGERVVIFSAFKTMVDLLAERFEEDGVPLVTYTGDTSRAARDDATRRFTDPGEDVTAFLCTDAAAEGLNLGRTCSTLVNADLPYTATRLEQRSNRIHRVDGTGDRYLVINLTLRGTIEEGIWQRVSHKASLMDQVFDETGAGDRTAGVTAAPEVTLESLLEAVVGPKVAPQLPLTDAGAA